jgi:AcrR family transcriptional regulator
MSRSSRCARAAKNPDDEGADLLAARLTPEARKQAILEAAVQVFAQHGLDAATTDDIARAAGLSKGGLYWHFRSKDDILAAILMHFFDQEMAVLKELLAATGTVGERLHQLGAQAAADTLQMEQLLPVVLEFYALASRQATVRAWIQGYYQQYHQLLAALLQQGYARGELRYGTAEAAALTLIAQIEGLGLVWSVAPGLVRLDQQIASAIDLLLHGLRAATE